MRRLIDVLPEDAARPAGWRLTAATAISGDGRTIAGNAINSSGQTEGWVWTAPPPSPVPTMSTWGLGALALTLTVGASYVLRRIADDL